MLTVPRSIVEAIFDQARRESPHECCGLLAGSNGKVARHFPATNAEASEVTYLIDSRELFHIHKAVREEGLDILSVYHSHTHPSSKAYPSRTDVNRAFWEGTDMETYPGCVYLVVWLKEGKEPVLKGFKIPDRATIEEVPVEVVDEEH